MFPSKFLVGVQFLLLSDSLCVDVDHNKARRHHPPTAQHAKRVVEFSPDGVSAPRPSDGRDAGAETYTAGGLFRPFARTVQRHNEDPFHSLQEQVSRPAGDVASKKTKVVTFVPSVKDKESSPGRASSAPPGDCARPEKEIIQEMLGNLLHRGPSSQQGKQPVEHKQGVRPSSRAAAVEHSSRKGAALSTSLTGEGIRPGLLLPTAGNASSDVRSLQELIALGVEDRINGLERMRQTRNENRANFCLDQFNWPQATADTVLQILKTRPPCPEAPDEPPLEKSRYTSTSARSRSYNLQYMQSRKLSLCAGTQQYDVQL